MLTDDDGQLRLELPPGRYALEAFQDTRICGELVDLHSGERRLVTLTLLSK